MKNKIIKYSYRVLVFLSIFLLFAGCTIKLGGGRSYGYSLTGASTGGAQTAVILYFQNRSPLIEPSLAQKLTEALKNKILSQTSLKLVNKDGDVNFEGSIESFGTQPTAVPGGNNLIPQSNRLTVIIKVKFNNSKNPHFDFETTFSRYIDAPGTSTLDAIIATPDYTKLIDQLVDDVFTKAFVNW